MLKIQNIPYLLIIGLCSLYSMYVVTHFLMFLGINEKVSIGISMVIGYITHSIIFDVARTYVTGRKITHITHNIILAFVFCSAIVVMEYYGLIHKIHTTEVDHSKVEILENQLLELRNQLNQTGVSNHYAKVELRRNLKGQIEEIQAEIKDAKLVLIDQQTHAAEKSELFSFYSIVVLLLSVLASIELAKRIIPFESFDHLSSLQGKRTSKLEIPLENKDFKLKTKSHHNIGFAFHDLSKEERLIQAWQEGERNIAKLCKLVKSNPVLIKQMINELGLAT